MYLCFVFALIKMSQTSLIEQRLTKTISDIKLITNDIRTIFKRLESITIAEADTRRVVDEKFKVLLSKINFNNLGDLITIGKNLIEIIRSNIYVLKSLDPVDNAEHVAIITSQITGDASETYTKTIHAPTYTRDVWTDKEIVGDDDPDFKIGDTINNVTVYTGSSPEDAFEYYTYDGEAMAKNAEGTDYVKGGSGELKDIELNLPASIKNSQILLNPSFDTSTDPKTLDTSKQISGFINENGIYLGEINGGDYEWKTDTEGNKTILKMRDGNSAPLYISPIDGIGINYDSNSGSYTTIIDADGLHTNNVNIATDVSADPYAGLNADGTFVKKLDVNDGTALIDENGNVITNNLYIGKDVYDPDDGTFKPDNALVSLTTDGDMKASTVKSPEDDPVFNIDSNGIVINKSDGKVTIGDDNVLNADGTVVCEYIDVKNGDTTTTNINGNAGIITATTGVNVTDVKSNTIFQLNNTDGIIVSPQGDDKVSINNTKVDASGNVLTGKITNNKSGNTEFTIDNSSIISAKITVGDTSQQSIIEVENGNGKITSSSVKVGGVVEVNDAGIATINGENLSIDGTEITTTDITTGSIIDGDVYIGPAEGSHTSNIEANEVKCDITTINNNGIVVNDPTTSSPYPNNVKCGETTISKSGMSTNSLMCGDGTDPYSYIGPIIKGTHNSNIETNGLSIQGVLDITSNGMNITSSSSNPVIIDSNTEITTGSISTTKINGISISDSEPQITHPLYINEAHSQNGTGIMIDINGITIQKETTINTNTVINDDSISTSKLSTSNASITNNVITANGYVLIDNIEINSDGIQMHTNATSEDNNKTITVNGVVLTDVFQNPGHLDTITINQIQTYNDNAYINSNEIYANSYVQIGENIKIEDGNISTVGDLETLTVNGVTLNDINESDIHTYTIETNKVSNHDAYINSNNIIADTIVIGTTQISSGNITLENNATVGGVTIKSGEIEATSLTHGDTYIGSKTVDDTEVQVLESPKLTIGNMAVLDENGITLESNSTVTLGSNNITIDNTGIVANSLTLKTGTPTSGPGLSLPVFAEIEGITNVFMYLLDSANNKFQVYLDTTDTTNDPILRVRWPYH